jgi:hypothetical protein
LDSEFLLKPSVWILHTLYMVVLHGNRC